MSAAFLMKRTDEMLKKRRFKKYKYNVALLFATIIITLCIGYSVFSESLSVRGNITAYYVISGSALNISLTQTSGKYTTGTFPTGATFENEVLSGNHLTINFIKGVSSPLLRSGTYIVTFKNIYPYSLTSGTISTIKVSGGTGVTTFSSTLAKATVTKATSSTFTTKITFTTNVATAINIQTTITYIINSVIQSFIYNIIID